MKTLSALSYLFLVAHKNLWRNPKRTFILLGALSFSLAFIIWNFNLSASGVSSILEEITRQYTGRQQLFAEGFHLKDGRVDSSYFLPQAPLPEEKGVGRVTLPSFVSGTKRSSGVFLVGIDPARERQWTRIHEAVQSGVFLLEGEENLQQKPLVMGVKLARKVGANIGDQVPVVAQGIDGSLSNDLFTLIGLLNFGGGDLEETLAFTTAAAARDFAMMPPDSYHVFVAFQEEPLVLSGKGPPVKIQSWKELLPDVAVTFTFIETICWVFSSILFLLVGLGLSNTFLVCFVERKRELYTLSIIGAPSGWIMGLFFAEILILTALALILGNLLGVGTVWYFHHYPINMEIFTGGKPIMMGGMSIHPSIKMEAHFRYFLYSSLLILLFIKLSVLYPLLKMRQTARGP